MRTIGVLVIEDEPMVAEVNKGFVNSVDGFEVLAVAGSGREGIDLAVRVRPELVLLDVYLPDMDGVTTLMEMRKLCIPLDVILVTAAQDTETVQNVLRYGAIDYIVKPFKLQRLKHSLESYALLKSRLTNQIMFNQDDIDQFTLNRNVLADCEGLPKGLNELTLKQVMLYLIKNQGTFSAEEVAEGTGLARVTARRYLEYLEKTGKVYLELQYGSVGRPVKRYKAVEHKDQN